jgi:hypothetical protein
MPEGFKQLLGSYNASSSHCDDNSGDQDEDKTTVCVQEDGLDSTFTGPAVGANLHIG